MSCLVRLARGVRLVHADILGFAWHGGGTGFHLRPRTVERTTVTIGIYHFSGAGAVEMEGIPPTDPEPDDPDSAYEEIAVLEDETADAVDAEDYAGVLGEMYGTWLKPKLQISVASWLTEETISAWAEWLGEVERSGADEYLCPQVAEARSLVATGLLRNMQEIDDRCRQQSDPLLANEVITWQRRAQALGLALTDVPPPWAEDPCGYRDHAYPDLTLDTVLSWLCLQVFVEAQFVDDTDPLEPVHPRADEWVNLDVHATVELDGLDLSSPRPVVVLNVTPEETIVEDRHGTDQGNGFVRYHVKLGPESRKSDVRVDAWHDLGQRGEAPCARQEKVVPAVARGKLVLDGKLATEGMLAARDPVALAADAPCADVDLIATVREGSGIPVAYPVEFRQTAGEGHVSPLTAPVERVVVIPSVERGLARSSFVRPAGPGTATFRADVMADGQEAEDTLTVEHPACPLTVTILGSNPRHTNGAQGCDGVTIAVEVLRGDEPAVGARVEFRDPEHDGMFLLNVQHADLEGLASTTYWPGSEEGTTDLVVTATDAQGGSGQDTLTIEHAKKWCPHWSSGASDPDTGDPPDPDVHFVQAQAFGLGAGSRERACDDGLDDDEDGCIDEADPDCCAGEPGCCIDPEDPECTDPLERSCAHSQSDWDTERSGSTRIASSAGGWSYSATVSVDGRHFEIRTERTDDDEEIPPWVQGEAHTQQIIGHVTGVGGGFGQIAVDITGTIEPSFGEEGYVSFELEFDSLDVLSRSQQNHVSYFTQGPQSVEFHQSLTVPFTYAATSQEPVAYSALLVANGNVHVTAQAIVVAP